MSKMGPDRQPTTGTCFALARLTPTCLLPTIVNFKKDPSFHYSWNLTGLLGQLLTFSWGLRQLYLSPPKPKSVGPTTTRGYNTRTNERNLSLPHSLFGAKNLSARPGRTEVCPGPMLNNSAGLPAFLSVSYPSTASGIWSSLPVHQSSAFRPVLAEWTKPYLGWRKPVQRVWYFVGNSTIT